MTQTGIYGDTYSDSYVAGGSGGGGTTSPRLNPNTPIVAGIEWLPTVQTPAPLSSARGVGVLLDSTVSENVQTIIAMVAAKTAGDQNAAVFAGVDIYDVTDVPLTGNQLNGLARPQSWAMAVPVGNGDGGGNGRGNGHGWQLANPLAPGFLDAAAQYDSTAWQRVNEVIASNSDLATATSDALIYSPGTSSPQAILFNGGPTLYDGDTGTQNQAISGQRIGRVEVVCVVRNNLPNGAQIDGVITDPSGNQFTSDSGAQSVAPGSGLKRLRFSFDWNPSNHQAWDAIAAGNFLNGTRTFGIQVAAQPNGSATSGLLCYAIAVQFHVSLEMRVATGYQSFPLGTAWQSTVLFDPVTRAVGPWAKVAGNQYLIVFHLTNDGGVANLRALSSSVVDHETDELDGISLVTVALDNGGGVPIADPVEIATKAPAFLLNAAPSIDSQPYASTQIYKVSTTATQRQLISTEVAGTFGAGNVVVQSEPDGQGGILQNAPLEVSLRLTADDSLLAGPASIDVADVPADGRCHDIDIRFPASVVLTTGEATYLEFTTSSTAPWTIMGLLTRDRAQSPSDSQSLAAAGVSAGGTADYTISDGDGDQTADLLCSIREVPPILTGLVATIATIPNKPALTTTPRPDDIAFASLSWTPSALTTQFARYEVQRQEPDGTWNTIYRITNEDSAYANDLELVRNTDTLFRVRVIGNPLGSSDWATFLTINVPLDDCAFCFTSNWDPDLSFAAQDVDTNAPERNFESVPGSGGLTIVPLSGTDMPAAFRQKETGGDIFTRRLGIAMNDQAVIDGTIPGERALLDVPIALFHSTDIAYVCVTFGASRWFASPLIQPGSGTFLGKITHVDVTFTETQSRPVRIDTPAPWAP